MPAWLLPAAIGLGRALNSWSQSKQADRAADLSEEELAFIKQRYAERAPLRSLASGQLAMGVPTRPNLTADFEDRTNPFYRAPQALGFGRMGTGSSTGPPQTPSGPMLPPRWKGGGMGDMDDRDERPDAIYF